MIHECRQLRTSLNSACKLMLPMNFLKKSHTSSSETRVLSECAEYFLQKLLLCMAEVFLLKLYSKMSNALLGYPGATRQERLQVTIRKYTWQIAIYSKLLILDGL